MAVGRGELNEPAIKSAIAEGTRELVGATAPAHGLTLRSVQYD
jgi:tRNA U38,U39,U40 pseudouridine synthase TruA